MTQDKALEVLQTGANVFLTGEPGAGKSHTIGRFTEWLDKQGKEYAITASTGIAASHIDGKTIHSWSGLGIRRGLDKQALEGVGRNMWVVQKIKPVKVLVIDEISMLDAVVVNDISNILQEVHNNKKPFGGIQVVFVGDFFQLPPVVKGNEERRFAFEAESWILAAPQICYLTEQHRQSDGVFLEILAAMRSGSVTEAHKATLAACQNNRKPETRLYTHNADVDSLNSSELAKLTGKPYEYKMIEWGDAKLIETLKRNCISPEKLVLKEGAVVMFTRNNFDAGYVNGSIGKVTGFSKGGDPIIKLQSGATVRPELAEWQWTQRREVKAYIRQIPLKLAWAVTVHKSQGMSLDSAAIDLTSVFEFGQGYVAISRVRTLAGLCLRGLNDNVFMMHPKVVEQDQKFREEGV